MSAPGSNNRPKVGDNVWLNEYGGLHWTTVSHTTKRDSFRTFPYGETHNILEIQPAVLAIGPPELKRGFSLVPERAEELTRRGLLIKMPQPLNTYVIHPDHRALAQILEAFR